MNPRSAYASVVRPTAEAPARAAFVAQWRQLLAEALDRVLRADGSVQPPSSSRPSTGPAEPQTPGDDTEKLAILVLAAIHGGSALSQISRDPWPLTAALDLALNQLDPSGAAANDSDRTG